MNTGPVNTGPVSRSRQLLVVRHAKSDRAGGLPDHDRPLNGRGRRDAPALGRWLSRAVGVPDLVLCSSAVRAVQTWHLAAAELQGEPVLDVRPALYLAPPEAWLAAVRDIAADVRVLVLVGHEPTQSALTVQLADEGSDPRAVRQVSEGFVTSGVAVLEVPTSWTDLAGGTARLRDFAVPRG